MLDREKEVKVREDDDDDDEVKKRKVATGDNYRTSSENFLSLFNPNYD